MKVDKDELYLIKDFLEEQLDLHNDLYEDDFEEDKVMFQRTIKLISKLIEESK